MLAWGPKLHEQRWRPAREEGVRGTERICGNEGIRIAPAERHGRGHGREQEGVELRSKWSERICGMARTQVHVRQGVQEKGAFKFFEIAAILVEDDGKRHAINFCLNCCNLRHVGRKVHLFKRPQCDLVCVDPSQSRTHSHMSAPPKRGHILCAQLLLSREVQEPLLREPTICGSDLRAGSGPLLNHEPRNFQWQNLRNPTQTVVT